MKTFATLLLALTLIALTWYSLGWIALLVIPSVALFALMTFAPLLTDWAQREEIVAPHPALDKRSTPC